MRHLLWLRRVLTSVLGMCPNKEFLPVRFFVSCIRTEYGDLLRKSPYSVQMQENTEHRNSAFGHFSRSAFITYLNLNEHIFNEANNKVDAIQR